MCYKPIPIIYRTLLLQNSLKVINMHMFLYLDLNGMLIKLNYINGNSWINFVHIYSYILVNKHSQWIEWLLVSCPWFISFSVHGVCFLFQTDNSNWNHKFVTSSCEYFSYLTMTRDEQNSILLKCSSIRRQWSARQYTHLLQSVDQMKSYSAVQSMIIW